MDARQILKRLISEYGGTQKLFASMIGVSQPSVASWLASGVIPPSGIKKMMDAIPDLDYDFLCGRSQTPYRMATPQLKTRGASYYPHLPATAGHVPAGDYDGTNEKIYVPGVTAEAYLPVSGNSMLPTLQSGDIVGLRRVYSVQNVRPNEIYMVFTAENERMLKRIKGIDEGEMLTLHSDNPEYEPFQVRKEDILTIYNVVCLIRNMN